LFSTYTILNEVRATLPGIPLHLWGIKLDALRSIDLSQVVSTDSAVWHGKYRRDDLRACAKASDMSMRRYAVTCNLPSYIEKVHKAVAESRRNGMAKQNGQMLEQVRVALRNSGGWTLDLSPRRNRLYAYAVRRSGSKREKRYLGPVEAMAARQIVVPGRADEEHYQLTMEYEFSSASQQGQGSTPSAVGPGGES
jgi:hypothetical protein